MTEPKPIRKVGHVVLKCEDLEKAREFYVDVLGMTLARFDPNRGMFLRFDDYHHDIAIFKTGPHAAPPTQNQVGLVHVALVVDDLDTVKAWYAKLKARGVPITGTADHAVTNSMYFKDPEGKDAYLREGWRLKDVVSLVNPFNTRWSRFFHLVR